MKKSYAQTAKQDDKEANSAKEQVQVGTSVRAEKPPAIFNQYEMQPYPYPFYSHPYYSNGGSSVGNKTLFEPPKRTTIKITNPLNNTEVVFKKDALQAEQEQTPPNKATKIKPVVVLKNPSTGEIITPVKPSASATPALVATVPGLQSTSALSPSKPPSRPEASSKLNLIKPVSKPVLTKAVKPAPVVHKVKSSPIVPEVKATVVAAEIKATPVAAEIIAIPVVPEVKAIPVVPEVKAIPVVPEVKATPVVAEVKATQAIHKVKPTPVVPEVKPQPAQKVADAAVTVFAAKPPAPITSPAYSGPPGLSSADANTPPSSTLSQASFSKEPLEEGELNEYLPDVPLIKDFTSITYPNSCKILPKIENGEFKYALDFLKSFHLITAKPRNILAYREIYGDDNMARSYSSGPKMSRQSSDRGRRINGRNSQSGSDRIGMTRQNSSRGHLPARNRNARISQPTLPPLVRGEHAWDPTKTQLDSTSKALKDIKGLLNKLTMDTFDKLSVLITNSDISNEDTLVGTIELIAEKAIDEPQFATIYAMLCSILYNELHKVQPWIMPTGKGLDNKFRQRLLKRCQNEFEKDAKWAEDDAAAQIERKLLRARIDELTAEEKLAIAEQDYDRQKLKRRVLGNIRFVGELFLVGIISESVIHRCIASLCSNIDDPEEEDIESLCKFVTATGKNLDIKKAEMQMDSYFERLQILSTSPKLSSRIKFLVMDVIDLRKNKWIPKSGSSTKPKTVAQVRKEAALEERQKQLDKMRVTKQVKPRRDDSGRTSNAARNQKEPDGWTSVKQTPAPADVKSRQAWGFKAKTSNAIESQMPAKRHDNPYGMLGGETSPTKPLIQKSEPEEEAGKEEESDNEPIPVQEDGMEVMERAFKDYRESLDSHEFLGDITGIEDEEVGVKLTRNIAQFLLDENGKPFLQVLQLVKQLFFGYEDQDAIFGDEHFVEGFRIFFVKFEDDVYDFPRGFANVATILTPLLLEKMISRDQFFSMSQPLKDYGGRTPMWPNFIAEIIKEASNPIELFCQTEMDLKDYFAGTEDEKISKIEKWIQMKNVPAAKTLHEFVSGIFQLCGYQVSAYESYRYFNKEADKEVFETTGFVKIVSLQFLKSITKNNVFNGDFSNPPLSKSKELFNQLKTQVLELKCMLVDLEISGIDLLFAMEEFCISNGITSKSKSNVDLIDDLFRISYDVELVAENVFYEYVNQCKPEIEGVLTKWVKYLKDN